MNDDAQATKSVCTIAGMLLTDLLQGRKNPWEDLYNPSRITLRAFAEYAGENINVAEQFADYVTAGEIKSVDELRPDNGAIMPEGLSVHTSVVLSRGTRRRRRGTVRATARNIALMAESTTARPTATSQSFATKPLCGQSRD